MAPFDPPISIISGIKDKVESFLVQGDRLYLGSATGTLYIYAFDPTDAELASLVETKRNFTRKAIEQIGFVKDINSLVVLSDKTITLYPLPSLSPATPLVQAKYVFSFALSTSILYILPDGSVRSQHEDSEARSKGVATFVTNLLIGCQRKMVLFSWKNGEAQPVKEVATPHSARAIAFINHQTAVLCYEPPDHALFALTTMTATDLTLPVVPASVNVPGIGNVGMGGFTGLSSYMSLGLSQKPKPAAVNIDESEVLITNDHSGVFVGLDGTQTRTAQISWPGAADEIAFVKPYIFAVLPPGTASTETLAPIASAVQIRSSFSLSAVQTLSFPSPSTIGSSSHYVVRLLSSSPEAKAPLFLLTTPVERAAAAAEGTTVWRVNMKPWGAQLDELIQDGAYVEALSLLNSLEVSVLLDKEARKTLIRGLEAVSQFKQKQFDVAIDTFVELEVNPAKVVALYPEIIAGRLSVPQERWLSLFGGPKPNTSFEPPIPSQEDSKPQTPTGSTAVSPAKATPPTGSIRTRFRKATFDAIIPSGPKDDDTASITSKRKEKAPVDDFRRSVEALFRYLPDRRPKIAGALAALHITPNQSHQFPFLSSTSVEDIFSMQDYALSALAPQQLVRYAQIVDTALLQAYILVSPSLLGSLCRVDNWCEVDEVEGILLEKQRYDELISLYHGKRMHKKALDLLKRRSDEVDNLEDKLEPSISYLQRLGADYAHVVFESSRWIFDKDSEIALQIFTSEEAELPRIEVINFLASVNPRICAKFIEFLIAERHEESTVFHDRLAKVYLDMTMNSRKAGKKDDEKFGYSQLLKFLSSSRFYRPDPLFSLLPLDDMFEVRAILFGRKEMHQAALEIYVYRLHDYIKAEEYCKSVYDVHASTKTIFLTLLQIYLKPTAKLQPSANLLPPALELISRHSPRLDPVSTLELLPPLVTTQDARAFLREALRAPRFDKAVIREIAKARNDSVTRKLMVLEANRVKVTDSRICPQCHKRLGSSVIAVHMPRGEVTHYQCREAFSRKLNESRVAP